MADFTKHRGEDRDDDDEEDENEEEEGEDEDETEDAADDEEPTKGAGTKVAGGKSSPDDEPVDTKKPRKVLYCPTCTMPPEFCEFGQTFDKCLPWIVANCPEVLSEKVLAAAMGDVSLEDGDDGGKKKRGGAAAPKKGKAVQETKVVIARIQRQKKKYVTAVAGLTTVPELNIKDAAKLLGKKFASGASIGESPTGQKEITIQGDVFFELPAFLIKELKVPGSAIYFLDEDKTSLRPYA